MSFAPAGMAPPLRTSTILPSSTTITGCAMYLPERTSSMRSAVITVLSAA